MSETPWGQHLPSSSPIPLSEPPRRSSGSPLAYTLAILLILGGVGAAAWHFFRPFFDRTPLPEKPAAGEVAAEQRDPALNPVQKSPPAPPAPTQVVPPVDAPETATTPAPPPSPQPPPTVQPEPPPAPSAPTPGAIVVEDVVPPAPSDPAAGLPSLHESMVREFQSRLDAFFQANTPQARVPLMFSELDDEAALAADIEKGSLSKLPKLEYKAVLAFDGPREGISQYYVAVTNTAASEDAANRELLLHLANHGDKGFRVNADALRFQLANRLPTFAATPSTESLRAYVFIERAHYFSGENQETPLGHICVNLRLGPYTPVICQALVDLGSEAGLEIGPLANWGDSPKAIIATLKQSDVHGVSCIVIDKFHCGNWLIAYPKAQAAPAP